MYDVSTMAMHVVYVFRRFKANQFKLLNTAASAFENIKFILFHFMDEVSLSSCLCVCCLIIFLTRAGFNFPFFGRPLSIVRRNFFGLNFVDTVAVAVDV